VVRPSARTPHDADQAKLNQALDRPAHMNGINIEAAGHPPVRKRAGKVFNIEPPIPIPDRGQHAALDVVRPGAAIARVCHSSRRSTGTSTAPTARRTGFGLAVVEFMTIHHVAGCAESGKRATGAVWLHRRHGLCARGEMRCVVPAHWSRLNVIDGEAAVLGRDGLSRFRLNYPDGRNVALSKELPLIELSIIFGMALIWGLFCVIVPKSQDEPGPGTDDPTGVGPGAGAGASTGTGG
jgi:hypothetical protein